MNESASRPRTRDAALWILGGIALLKLVLHLALAGRHGYFRDELYYLACAEHLDWGYVDQPPLIAVYAWLARTLLGDSLFAIRLLPAVAGAVTVFLAGLIARELGGSRFAQGIAALAVVAAPIHLGMNIILTMNAFEPLFWMGCVYVLIRILKGGDARLWLAFGALAGLGLQNKHSTLFFGFAVVVGMLLTPARRQLLNKWMWAGGAVALLVFLPNLIWQAQRGFPTLELLQNVERTGKNVVLSPVEFIVQQIVILHPVLFPLWVAGLVYFLAGKPAREFRALGYAYLVLLAVFIVLHGKNYYLAPIYPMLFAAGGIALDAGIRRAGRERLKPAAVAVIVVAGGVLAPIILPVLPPERYASYESALGIKRMSAEQSHIGSPLPQLFSDQFGWEEMAAATARVYNALPREERARTYIFGNNYGEAAAIDLFGPRYGLPKSISGHQNYWYWGPRGYDGGTLIILGSSGNDLPQQFESVEAAGTIGHPYAMPSEHFTIWVCRGLRAPVNEAWRRAKNWR